MKNRSMKDNLQGYGLRKVLDYLDSDPDRNIPRVLNWVEKFDREGTVARQFYPVRRLLDNPDSNWYRLVKSLWAEIDDGVRKSFFQNFIINATILGQRRQQEIKQQNQCNVPWAILLDPTAACNIRCSGCWAGDYDQALDLSIAELDDIIEQGKQLGVHMYIYSGGEPLISKKDLNSLCEKHSDCTFMAFTNGTLVDEAFSEEILRVKNFIPCISVEGFREENDARRGEGTYAALMEGMNILKGNRLPFGISCCYTSQNTVTIGSEEYIDFMIERGARFAWFFTYMPVGKSAIVDLMVSPEQRKYMYDQVRKFRRTKPIFALDFWNDGEYINGCIAGGRKYLHINANGDVEPCAFIHYADSNIREKSLLECLKSPLFKQYYLNQPFNSNHLRPCPLLDNPHCLPQMVDASGAVSTDMQSPENVHHLAGKCQKAAERWAPVAEGLWIRSGKAAGSSTG